jgi:hypothetical protein
VGFDSFWDVYNQLRDAVDSEFLFQSSIGAFDEESTSKDSDTVDIEQLPLSHLRPCEFGKDGIPAEQVIHEGIADCLSFSFWSKFIVFAPEEEERHAIRARHSAEEGMVLYLRNHLNTHAHIYLGDNMMVEFSDDEGDEIF